MARVCGRSVRWAVLLAVALTGCGKNPPVAPPTDNSGHLAGDSLTVPLPGGLSLDLAWVPPGVFDMGSPEYELFGWPDEQPQHSVTLTTGFWLSRRELTQAQWQAVMATRPWDGQEHVQPDSARPAVYISWDDAQRLVQALNAAAGDSLYRLPTEAEWEYACRAGTRSEWSFGDNEVYLPLYAWYYDNTWDLGLEVAQPVGTRRPNPWGLYDMHGNVYEWVQDYYGPYSSRAQTDPNGPQVGDHRVVRGGSFPNQFLLTRSAFRDYAVAGTGHRDVGLRLVRRSVE